MPEAVLLKREKEIAHLVLNRPEAFNAMNLELVEAFTHHLMGLAVDESVRAVVITGEGKAFCAGGDLKWALGYPQGPAASLHVLAGVLHQGILEVRGMAKPVIAAVNGVAAGAGFSLAIGCDFRVMARSASFRQAYTSNGLCIDGGGTFALPRLVGMARALEIAGFDAPISSDQALAWGLVTKIVGDGKVVEEATAMATQLVSRSLHSFGLSKRLFNESFHTPLEAQLESERAGIRACAAHPDGQEGMKAFSQKRKPVFHQGGG